MVPDRLTQLVDAHLDGEAISATLVAEVRLDAQPGFDLLSNGHLLAERRFSSLPRDCDSIHSTFAVAIAIAFEHANSIPSPSTSPTTEQEGPPEPDRKPAPRSGPTPEAPPAKARTASSSTAPKQKFQLVLSTAGALLLEVLPKPAASGTFSLKLVTPSRFSLSGTFLYSSRIVVPFQVGSARARLLGGQVHGCFEGASGRWRPAGCLGFSWGSLHAAGQAIWDAGEDNSYWLATSAKGNLRRLLGKRWGFEGSTEIFINLLRPGVQDRASGGQVENAAPVGGAISLGAFVVLG